MSTKSLPKHFHQIKPLLLPMCHIASPINLLTFVFFNFVQCFSLFWNWDVYLLVTTSNSTISNIIDLLSGLLANLWKGFLSRIVQSQTPKNISSKFFILTTKSFSESVLGCDPHKTWSLPLTMILTGGRADLIFCKNNALLFGEYSIYQCVIIIGTSSAINLL